MKGRSETESEGARDSKAATPAPREPNAGAGVTIGELAALAGVTAEAIRYYEREGVLPAPVRRGTGRYRQYGDVDVVRLRFIRRARDLGFSLDEVRELVGLSEGDPDHSCTDVNRIANAHLVQVDAKLAQLTVLRSELDRIIAGCNHVVSVAECHILGALGGH